MDSRPLDDLEDHDLLQHIAQEHEAAFDLLIMRHADQVQGYLSRHCGSWNIIEEVTQEVFVRAWQNAAKFRGESSVRTWLIGIARNALREATRQRSKHLITLETRLAELTPTIDDDEHASSDHDEQALSALSECLQQLPTRAQRLIAARYQDGTPLPELARNYKKKATALARQLQRLAASLRNCMQERLHERR